VKQAVDSSFAGGGSFDSGQPEQWWVPSGAWCIRREWIGNSNRRVVIRPGVRALVFVGDQVKEVTGQAIAGAYEISGSVDSLRQTSATDLNRALQQRFGSQFPPLSLILLDSVPKLMSIEIEAKTSDPLDAQVTVAMDVAVTDLGRFLSLLGAKNELLTNDIQERLLNPGGAFGVGASPFGALINSLTLEDLCTEEGQNALSNRLNGKLQSQLQTYGLEVRQWWVHVRSDDPAAQRVLDVRRSEFEVGTFRHEVQVQDQNVEVLLEAKSLSLKRVREERELEVGHLEESQSFSERELELLKSDFDRVLRQSEFESDQLARKTRIREQLKAYREALGEADLDETLGEVDRGQRLREKIRELEKANNVGQIIDENEIALLYQTLSNKRNFSQLCDELNVSSRLRQEQLDQLAHQTQATVQQGKTEQVSLQIAIESAQKQLDFHLDSERRQALQRLEIEDKTQDSIFERTKREQRERLEQVRLEQELRVEELRAKAQLASQIERDSTRLGMEKDEHEAALHMRLKDQNHRQSIEATAQKQTFDLDKAAQEKMFEIDRIVKMSSLSPEQIALLSNSSVEAIQAIAGAKQGVEMQAMLEKQMTYLTEAAAHKKEAELLREANERERDMQQQLIALQNANTADLKEVMLSNFQKHAEQAQSKLNAQDEAFAKEKAMIVDHQEKIESLQERENMRLDSQNERYVDAQVKQQKKSDQGKGTSTPKVNINIASDKQSPEEEGEEV